MGGEQHDYSVSPFELENGGGGMEEDEEDEEDVGVEVGEACAKVRVESEGATIKKLIDPKLPSKEDVDRHWIKGHVEYRNWCEVCVKARAMSLIK